MPKALRRRTYRSTFLRRALRTDLPMVYYALIAILGGFLLAWLLTNTVHFSKNTFSFGGPQQGYTVVGTPTIKADFIEQVLTRYHSPAVGKGKVLYDYGVKYAIDPAFALAFFLQESTFGTQGMARVFAQPLDTHNVMATASIKAGKRASTIGISSSPTSTLDSGTSPLWIKSFPFTRLTRTTITKMPTSKM